MLSFIYNNILYQPLFNLLVFFYNIIPGNDMGVAIILVTILIRLAMYPLSNSTLKSQKSMQSIQPKIDDIKVKYKNDKEKQAQEMMKLYKDEKVNPFSSCLPLLIQLPIFIAVYRVFSEGLASTDLSALYPFVKNPGMLSAVSLGFINLAKPSIPLAILAGAAQYWQTKMLLVQRPPKDARKQEGARDEDTMAIVNKQMSITMPIFTVFLGISLPGGLSLYWLVTTLVSVLQQYLVLGRGPQMAPVIVKAETVLPAAEDSETKK